MTLSILDNALIQGLLYSSAVAGLILSFRVLRYPDLTADGSFLLGATALAVSARANLPWVVGVLLAAAAGAACGCMTGLFHYRTHVNKLLSGVLSSMVCYSLAFRLLGSRPTVGIADPPGPLAWVAGIDATQPLGQGFHPALAVLLLAITGVVVIAFAALLQTDWGLMLRAVGSNVKLVEGLGRRSDAYTIAGLACANLLVGLSGALVASQQQFVDVNMAIGLVIVLAAAMVFGEHLITFLGLDSTRSMTLLLASGALGVVAYYLLYLVVLRASVLGWLGVSFEPSDIKLLSALVLAAGSLLSHRRRGHLADLVPF